MGKKFFLNTKVSGSYQDMIVYSLVVLCGTKLS